MTEGATRIGFKAMEKIVVAAIHNVPGSATVEAKLGGLGSRGFPRVALQMDPQSQTVAIDVAIAAGWPSPVTAVADATRTAIASSVRTHTGYEPTRVNVTVGSLVPAPRVDADTVTRAAATASAGVATRSPKVRPLVANLLSTTPSAPAITPQPLTVTSPTTPQAPQVRHIRVPRPQQLRPVRLPMPREVHHPTAPTPQPLRAISVTPLFGSSGKHDPQSPKQGALK